MSKYRIPQLLGMSHTEVFYQHQTGLAMMSLMERLLKAGPHPLCWGWGGCVGVTVISTRFIMFYSFMVRHCVRHQFCPAVWSRRSQTRLTRLFLCPLLTLEKNNCRNTVYLPSNSFSLGPHSPPYLHPALSQFAYPVSALRLRFWLAWISILVSKVRGTAAV